MIHKAQIRIPLKEYSYIELEAEGTPEELKEIYDDMMRVCQTGEGLSDKDFMKLVDRYVTKGDMDTELYESLNDYQKAWVQITRKAFNRINARSK